MKCESEWNSLFFFVDTNKYFSARCPSYLGMVAYKEVMFVVKIYLSLARKLKSRKFLVRDWCLRCSKEVIERGVAFLRTVTSADNTVGFPDCLVCKFWV